MNGQPATVDTCGETSIRFTLSNWRGAITEPDTVYTAEEVSCARALQPVGLQFTRLAGDGPLHVRADFGRFADGAPDLLFETQHQFPRIAPFGDTVVTFDFHDCGPGDASAACRSGDAGAGDATAPTDLGPMSDVVPDVSATDRAFVTDIATDVLSLPASVTARWTVNGAPASATTCAPGASYVTVYLDLLSVNAYVMSAPCAGGSLTFPRVEPGDYTVRSVMFGPTTGGMIHTYDPVINASVHVSSLPATVDIPLIARGSVRVVWTVNGGSPDINCPPGLTPDLRPISTVTLVGRPTAGSPVSFPAVRCSIGTSIGEVISLVPGSYTLSATLDIADHPTGSARVMVPAPFEVTLGGVDALAPRLAFDIPCPCCANPPAGSTCAPMCLAGEVICEGGCHNELVDNFNCGFCGHVCSPTERCIRGACESLCPSGFTGCLQPSGDVTCSTLVVDDANCGACGNACDIGFSCGRLSPFGVPGCHANCSGFQTYVCPRGDCIAPHSDPANCGGCLIACATGQVCRSGACEAM